LIKVLKMNLKATVLVVSIASPLGLIAQNRCPVVGDTITVTGQVSIREVNGLKLPDLHAKTFPNRFQPICIMVKPYIGAGVGRVDRVVGQISHMWLVSPKQKDANGNIDWERPEPIPTDVFLEVTGKLIGQGVDRLGSPPYGTSEVTLEVSDIKNVDAEINNAVKAWRDDCLQWVEAQLTPEATATWKNPPRAGEQPKVNAYHIEPFASVNGAPQPKCAASVAFNAAKGGYFANWSLARVPWVVDNLGGISFSPTAAPSGAPLSGRTTPPPNQPPANPAPPQSRVAASAAASSDPTSARNVRMLRNDAIENDPTLEKLCIDRTLHPPNTVIGTLYTVPFLLDSSYVLRVRADYPDATFIAVSSSRSGFGGQLVECSRLSGGKFGPATQSPEGNWYWSLIKPQQLRGPGWMSIAADRCRRAAERKAGDTGIERSSYSSVQEVAEGRQIAGMLTAAWDVEVKGDVVLKGPGPDLPVFNFSCLLSPMLEVRAVELQRN
jgi:hypothetical protein